MHRKEFHKSASTIARLKLEWDVAVVRLCVCLFWKRSCPVGHVSRLQMHWWQSVKNARLRLWHSFLFNWMESTEMTYGNLRSHSWDLRLLLGNFRLLDAKVVSVGEWKRTSVIGSALSDAQGYLYTCKFDWCCAWLLAFELQILLLFYVTWSESSCSVWNLHPWPWYYSARVLLTSIHRLKGVLWRHLPLHLFCNQCEAYYFDLLICHLVWKSSSVLMVCISAEHHFRTLVLWWWFPLIRTFKIEVALELLWFV